MAWAKLATNDLSAAGVNIDNSITATKFIHWFKFTGSDGSAVGAADRVGFSTIDTGTNYAYRYSGNGGTDGTGTSRTNLALNILSDTNVRFHVTYAINIATEEKLFTSFSVYANTAGAATAPQRAEWATKWANTSNQFDETRHYSDSGNNFNSGSNSTVLTGDETETVTLQDGTIFEETDTNKAYIWSSSSQTWTQL